MCIRVMGVLASYGSGVTIRFEIERGAKAVTKEAIA